MQRILERTEITPGPLDTPCWIWTGYTTDQGYGRIAVGTKAGGDRRQAPVHRFAFEYYAEPLPGGMVPDHLCRVPACWNPDHLEVVTPRENTLRGFGPPACNARRTHCVRGHEFTPENTYQWRSSRICRECRKLVRAS